MEELNLKYEQLLQALRQLELSLKSFQKVAQRGACTVTSVEDKHELFVHRDSVILRFGLCSELLWKFCKLTLWHTYGVEANSRAWPFKHVMSRILLLPKSCMY